jgi:hypothetical protein
LYGIIRLSLANAGYRRYRLQQAADIWRADGALAVLRRLLGRR